MSIGSAGLRAVLRAILAANTARFLVQRRPVGYPRSRRTGHDPLRIMIVGAGVAIGYGVHTLEESLNGQLADALHAELGRGITVENVVSPAMPLNRTVHRLGPNGAHTYRAVVFTPGLLEMTRGETKHWRAELEELIQHLRDTGGADVRIVLVGLPVPIDGRRIENAIAARVTATNAVMADVAASDPLIGFAPTPTMTTFRGRRSLDAAFYAETARSVAGVLVPLLGPHRHHPELNDIPS